MDDNFTPSLFRTVIRCIIAPNTENITLGMLMHLRSAFGDTVLSQGRLLLFPFKYLTPIWGYFQPRDNFVPRPMTSASSGILRPCGVKQFLIWASMAICPPFCFRFRKCWTRLRLGRCGDFFQHFSYWKGNVSTFELVQLVVCQACILLYVCRIILLKSA